MKRSTPILVLAWLTTAIAVVTFLIVIAAWLRTPNPDYSCQQGLWPDLQGTNAIGEGGVGHWSWAPVGLVCDFPTESGGRLVTTPGPALSIVLVSAFISAIVAIALFIARAAALRIRKL